jgi:UDP-3-O-[3-hydroxymyristoyl] glucosamine N-acyltransferase
MVLLSDVKKWVNGQVERDGSFERLGYLSHLTKNILVPLYDSAVVGELQQRPNIVAVVTTKELASFVPVDLAVLIVAQPPMEALIRIHCQLAAQDFYPRHEKTFQDHGSHVDGRAYVSDIGVFIGKNVTVGPNATILPGTILEDDTFVGPNTVLGGLGFEVRQVDGAPLRVPHVGGVQIQTGTAVFTNCSVARSLFADHTRVGPSSTIDNLVNVSHNVSIGARCRVGAGAYIGGSTSVGDDVWIGPNATISNGLNIGHKAEISLGSVVTRDVAIQQRVTGNFALPHEEFLARLKGRTSV